MKKTLCHSLTNNEIIDTSLEVLDILFVPGGFYRWFKREDKEPGDISSKAEKNIRNYIITPSVEILKTGMDAGIIYLLYNLVK